MKITFATLLFLPTAALAGEFEVGRLSLPPCSKVEYKQQTVLPFAKINVPEVRQAPQTVLVSAVIEGTGIDSPKNAEAVKGCVTFASEIGAYVIASDPAGATPLFKERLVSCLRVRAPNTRVEVLFLKSASQCAW
jgi:hypothetical protein